MEDDRISLAHGNGGRFMRELIEEVFARHLGADDTRECRVKIDLVHDFIRDSARRHIAWPANQERHPE